MTGSSTSSTSGYRLLTAADTRLERILAHKIRNVTSMRNADVDGVIGAVGAVVLFEAFAKRVCRDAHNRVRLRIEVGGSTEGVDSDAVFFDVCGLVVEILIANKRQQANDVVTSAEDSRCQNGIELGSFGSEPVFPRSQAKSPGTSPGLLILVERSIAQVVAHRTRKILPALVVLLYGLRDQAPRVPSLFSFHIPFFRYRDLG